MTQVDYTYTFTDLQERLGAVWVTHHRQNKQQLLQVSANDARLFPRDCHRVPAQVADVVDLATAVYTADRLSVRRGEKPCFIHLQVPVRDPEALSHAAVVEQLQEVLYWYTNDHWSFTFTKRAALGRSIELQGRLRLSMGPPQPTEVALCSGGLDSLAGLCNRMVASPATQFVLFGTGGNSYVLNVQRKLTRAVRQQIPEAKHLVLIQVPIHLAEISGMRRNRHLRARGFVFLLLGAVAAHLQGQDTLWIYENGIGAINLPFRASEVGLDHARSVHPLSLVKMGRLVSLLLGTSFFFRNPFLFWTKAQMCQVFINTHSINLIASTITCDRRHRQQFGQCGCCSSCLLRRQALAVLNIQDETRYVVPDGRPPQPADRLHLESMLHQVALLRALLAQPTPWVNLVKQYGVLHEIVQETAPLEGLSPQVMSEQMVWLYTQYVQEWDQVEQQVKARVLPNNELAPVSCSGVTSLLKGPSNE